MNIGERIKLLRTQRSMTQKEVAQKCGMADSAIRKYESGKIKPKFETLIKIAAALNVDVSELLELEPLPMKIEKSEDGEKIYIESPGAQRRKAYFDYLEKDGIHISLYEEGRLEKRDDWLFLMEDKRAGDSYLVKSSEIDELEERTMSYSRFQIDELKGRSEKVK